MRLVVGIATPDTELMFRSTFYASCLRIYVNVNNLIIKLLCSLATARSVFNCLACHSLLAFFGAADPKGQLRLRFSVMRHNKRDEHRNTPSGDRKREPKRRNRDRRATGCGNGHPRDRAVLKAY